MTFAKTVFFIAGLWGPRRAHAVVFHVRPRRPSVSAIISHPDFYYGFIGVAVV